MEEISLQQIYMDGVKKAWRKATNKSDEKDESNDSLLSDTKAKEFEQQIKDEQHSLSVKSDDKSSSVEDDDTDTTDEEDAKKKQEVKIPLTHFSISKKKEEEIESGKFDFENTTHDYSILEKEPSDYSVLSSKTDKLVEQLKQAACSFVTQDDLA